MKNTTSTISMMGPSKNDKRPIAKFYRCWLEDISRGVPVQKCRGINLEQYEAADRLICGYERLFTVNHRGFVEISRVKANHQSAPELLRKVMAMQDHSKVMTGLSKVSRQILQHFCLDELPLCKFEQAQVPQWPKGAGSVRLREALDDLIEVYRWL